MSSEKTPLQEICDNLKSQKGLIEIRYYYTCDLEFGERCVFAFTLLDGRKFNFNLLDLELLKSTEGNKKISNFISDFIKNKEKNIGKPA